MDEYSVGIIINGDACDPLTNFHVLDDLSKVIITNELGGEIEVSTKDFLDDNCFYILSNKTGKAAKIL